MWRKAWQRHGVGVSGTRMATEKKKKSQIQLKSYIYYYPMCFFSSLFAVLHSTSMVPVRRRQNNSHLAAR